MAKAKDDEPQTEAQDAPPEEQKPPEPQPEPEPPPEPKQVEAVISFSFDPNVGGPTQCKATSTVEGQSFSSYGQDWQHAESNLVSQIQNYLSMPEQKKVTVKAKSA